MLTTGIHDTYHTSLVQLHNADKYGREKGPRFAIKLEDGSLEYESDKVLNRNKKRGKIL